MNKFKIMVMVLFVALAAGCNNVATTPQEVEIPYEGCIVYEGEVWYPSVSWYPYYLNNGYKPKVLVSKYIPDPKGIKPGYDYFRTWGWDGPKDSDGFVSEYIRKGMDGTDKTMYEKVEWTKG